MSAEPSPEAPSAGTGDEPAAAPEAHGPVRLSAPQVTTCLSGTAGGSADKASVLVSCRLRNADDEEREGVLGATLRDTGQVVERRFRLGPEGEGVAALPELTVMFPHLWEPLRGEPGDDPRALYSIDLEVSVNGVLADRRRVRFGIREVALVEVAPEEGEPGDGAEGGGESRDEEAEHGPRARRPALAVNGRPLDLGRGAGVATWAPPAGAAGGSLEASAGGGREADAATGEGGLEGGADRGGGDGPAARAPRGGGAARDYHGEVGELAGRGVTLLRVPWGDPEERDALLSACDEHGVPVALALWPGSGIAAGAEPGAEPDAEPHERLVEAREALRRLRNHPSLVLWLGSLEGPPPEDLDHCLRCYVTGVGEDGEPCRFAGRAPCGHEGVLDGTRPYRSEPGALLPPSRGVGGEDGSALLGHGT